MRANLKQLEVNRLTTMLATASGQAAEGLVLEETVIELMHTADCKFGSTGSDKVAAVPGTHDFSP